MTKYVVQVSSLYPIDLAACLYAGIFDQKAQFRIFLSDIAKLPKNKNVRCFVARSALPLCHWSLDDNKVWRQHHLPLESDKKVEMWANALQEVSQSLMGSSHNNNMLITLHCDHLLKTAQQRALSKSRKWWKKSWSPFMAGIIEEIFHQVLNANITVEPYYLFRKGKQGRNPAYESASYHALNRLFSAASEVYPGYLTFYRGGSIQIKLKHGSNKWLKCSKLRFDGRLVEIATNNSDTIDFRPTEIRRFRFIGPLEQIQLQEFGRVVDLPWYSDAQLYNSPSSSSFGIELISPISLSDNRRVSRKSGGEGFRLSPAGYSLVEYDSPIIHLLIQEKLKLPMISSDALKDWRHLINNFPRTSQRLSKHQGSVRAYRNFREIDEKKHIAFDDTRKLQILEQTIENINPLLYGYYLAEFLSICALLKEWCIPACPNSAGNAVLRQLEKMNWLAENGTIQPEVIVLNFEKNTKKVMDWLESQGWSFNQDMHEEISRASNILLQRGKRSIIVREDSSWSGFGLITKILRELIDIYYGFAGFCCSSLFKAHVLYPYLLLGAEGYRSEIKRIFLLRQEEKSLFFEPDLWQISM